MVSAFDRLVVLADPGMGKSWLLRLEASRRPSAAAALLEQSADASEVTVPIPVRADVLATAPGSTLAEVAAGYLAREGLLAARPEGPMRDLIAGGGAVLLYVDPEPAAERSGQVAQPLTAASTDVQHGVGRTEVTQDYFVVLPRHGLPCPAHAGEVPAAPGLDASENLLQSLLRIRLQHDQPS